MTIPRSIVSVLDEKVRAVAPIDGVSIGHRDDKTTWRVDFRPEATRAQRDAAAAVLAAFDVATEQAAADRLERQRVLVTSPAFVAEFLDAAAADDRAKLAELKRRKDEAATAPRP